MGLIILSCSDWDLERVGFTQVITIGVIEVGANSAFLIGDIENIREANIVESGFVLSATAQEDENLRLDQASVIQVLSPGLDTISEDRAFAARATGLNGSTEYAFRAYVKIEGEEQVAYGNIDRFTTSELNVSLQSVRRTSEGCPTTAMVEVQVDGLAPGGGGGLVGIVYSTNVNNLAPTVDNGILVMSENADPSGLFNIPIQAECGESYFLRIVLNPESTNPQYSNAHAFTMIEGGLWNEKSSFLGRVKSGKPVSFAYERKGYMGGGGSLGVAQNRTRVWTYEADEDLWAAGEEIENMDLSESVSVVVEDKIYVGSGFAPMGHCGKIGTTIEGTGGTTIIGLGPDIDGTVHTWESLCGSCDAEECIVCGEHLYEEQVPVIGVMRFGCLCYNRGTILYDPIENTGTYSDERLLGLKSNAFLFVIQNNTYVLGGDAVQDAGAFYSTVPEVEVVGNCTARRRTCVLSVLQFDGESILIKDEFPGEGRLNLTGFAVGALGYAGLGTECTQNLIEGENGPNIVSPIVSPEELIRMNSFYAFNPNSAPGAQWQEVESYPGSGDNIMAFSSDKRGYVVFNTNDGTNIMWQFDPNADSDGEWSEIGAIPDPTDKKPYHLFTIGNISYVYFPTTANNFWMYIPEL